jgi:hypothetical protein
MSFENEWKKVDASRVRGVAVARVQPSGRLIFTEVAQKLMGIRGNEIHEASRREAYDYKVQHLESQVQHLESRIDYNNNEELFERRLELKKQLAELKREQKYTRTRYIEIYESQSGNGDLAACVLGVGEKKAGAFEVKESGMYLYLSFRQFLQERGVDFVNQEVSYEVTRMDEELDGHGVFKLTRKIAPRVSFVTRPRRSVSIIYKGKDTEE